MNGTASPTARVPGLDGLRGLAVLTMAVGNFGLGVAWVPDWLKHAPDVGFTIADLVAPVFIVASGLSLRPAVERRRAARGTRGAMGWLAARSLALIGIGAVITAGQLVFQPAVAGTQLYWGVLQAIGGASLITALVILQPAWVRALVGLLTLAVYQWVLDAFWLDAVRRSVHNGLPGTIAWGGLMMLATAAADAWRATSPPRRRIVLLVLLGVASIVTALALTPWFPIAKARASATYMLLSLGLSLLLFALFDATLDPRPRTLLWLQRVGRQPLALYLAHLLFLAPFTLGGNAALYEAAPAWLTIVEVAVLAGVLVALAGLMDRRGVGLRL